MRLLDFFRNKRKAQSLPTTVPSWTTARHAPSLPKTVVESILRCIGEQAGPGTSTAPRRDHCAACASRNLARCAMVNRTWHEIATPLLYAEVDLDAVHSCGIVLDDARRAKRKRGDKNQLRASPSLRLELLLRTMGERRHLGNCVLTLKAASARDHQGLAKLAALVRSLPHLRWIDLPLAFYKAGAATLQLRHELEVNCPDIRSMIYCGGTEIHISKIASYNCWPQLEVLELSSLATDVTALRQVLGAFRRLRVLRLSQMATGDALFMQLQGAPSIPPLRELHIEDDGTISGSGLSLYLSDLQAAASLRHLSLARTGVSISNLYALLTKAFNLQHMMITQEVDCNFYVETKPESCFAAPLNVPLLASSSLRDLTFDVSPSRNGSWPDAASYYEYLLPSIQRNLFPDLQKLLVGDADFIHKLLHRQPMVLACELPAAKIRTAEQPLEVYVKGSSELPWSSATLATYYTSSLSDELDRPVDARSINLGTKPWMGGARKSVLLGSGLGNFIAMPQTPAELDAEALFQKSFGATDGFVTTRRLEIADGAERRSRINLWR